jgi:hypothetical protein
VGNLQQDADGRRDASVAVLLQAPRQHPVGEPVPIRVEVGNVGERETCLVGVLDGSETGIRYPHYRPSVTLDGEIVAAPPTPEDPLVGPIRSADIQRVRPGEGFDPTDRAVAPDYMPLFTFVTFRPARPGTYRFRLMLDMTERRPDAWFGRIGQTTDEQLLDLLAAVPPAMVSTFAEVDVVERM